MEDITEKLFTKRESGTDTSINYDVIRVDGGVPVDEHHDLICEEPLLIRVDEVPYSVIMRTPGDETYHAAGFCLAEGIVENYSDFNSIGFCADMDPNVVEVILTPERHKKIESLLDRKGFLSQTSCGICGKVLIEEISQLLKAGDIQKKVTVDEILESGKKLVETQKYYKRTRGSHGIVLLDKNLDVMSIGEDVGRHNALDKAVGRVLVGQKIKDAYMAVLTSRISFEMIQKANRAGIYFMLSRSRPTALAVELGRSLNMTLVCQSDGKDMIVFSGQERIIW